MKNIVVLGANGQLGETIKSIANKELYSYSFLSKEDLDITDKDSVLELFKLSKFDYCVNCAAYTNVEGAEKNIEAAFLINAEGVKNIAEACELNDVTLIHVSTDYVFDGKKGKPYSTTDKTNPINQYGKSKLKGEGYIQNIMDDYYIIRTSWLYSLQGKNFLKTIVGKIENNDVLNITTQEEGTPTSCKDLAEFILYIIHSDDLQNGIYNFSANSSTTWYGFAREIVRNLDHQKIENIQPVEKFSTLAKRPEYSVLDLEKTEKNYMKLNNWKKSVEVMVNDYKNQNG